MPTKTALIIAAAILASSAPALAKKDKGVPPGHTKMEKAVHAPKHHGWSAARFAPADVSLVRSYFVSHPPQWTALPPGIAKNVARGKPLPPGIAKKMLPQSLAAQLPQYPGHEYAMVGRDVVLIETATRLVVDVLEKVFD